ncbi:uncharacterized protein BDZ99DRAFT_517273 [Mytilinidion resinicola]|uniref:Uncharacterized protein n=1 Tax=Mytilinidion resinicola TaxID=574789 RepID=A0A6A6YVZ7_9PEZI|nr:uncharacterized protein BDZ99DRAFT_517273 [Mytilinidion resinicola]KAF2812981.1 hypothetical protein BDZ99DRAFT_517273 [Mytilinidion resinicola]
MDHEEGTSFARSGSNFEPSLRPSRQRPGPTSSYILDGLASLASASEGRTSVQVVIDLLRKSGLPGPVSTLQTDSTRVLLGQGAQFAVYRESTFFSAPTGSRPGAISSYDVAVKQPKFSQDLFSKFSLADPEAQKHLHTIWLEILAFTDPQLREHPNIAKLLA